jgi:hypothetical protein
MYDNAFRLGLQSLPALLLAAFGATALSAESLDQELWLAVTRR